MKKIISILCAITIALSTLAVCEAKTVDSTQKIKINGTVGHRPCWGAWFKWFGKGYSPYVYYIKVDKKPKTMNVSTKDGVLPTVPIGKFMNKPQEGVSVSYYNGYIQIFLGVKGNDPRAYLRSKPVTVLLRTDETPVKPIEPIKPEQPKPETPKPEQPKPEQPKPEQPKPEEPKDPQQPNQAIKDWDAFNNTHGNYVAYSPSQVAVNGKKIKMTAIKKTTTVAPKGGTGYKATKNYLSGAMVSKKAYKYGTFTFKFRLSANNTLLWPMIWTLPDDVTMARPEFDLLESWGSKTGNSIVQTYHAFDSNGKSLANLQQKATPVDLTKEHTLKMVWTQDNVVKMYVDGVLKLTIKDYMVNYKTKQVDYQVWFLNLGLGGYDGTAPNGTGWFEITDYDFQPVYTKDRTRQHYWSGNFTDGTLPSGKY